MKIKCSGASCPLRKDCNKYAPKLTKDYSISTAYFSSPPFDHIKKSCNEYESIDMDVETTPSE